MRGRIAFVWVILCAALLAACGQAGASGGVPDLQVAGNHFVAGGKTTRLMGVNITGGEFVCVGPAFDDFYKNGVWAYPVDDDSISAIASWKVNAVRIPLNEDCWLGINPTRRGGAPKYKVTRLHGSSGASVARRESAHYRAEVKALVARLHSHGLYAILDLHWTAPGSTLASQQYPLPDADHSPAFWRSVAKAFKSDRSTVFEVFNEPMLAGANGDTLRWSCLRDGCTIPNRCADCEHPRPHGTFKTAGFQKLVDTIRRTGAQNVVLVPGRFYSNDLGQWLKYKPSDPLNQLGATFHAYELPKCHDISCWSTTIADVAAQVPVTTTEYGSDQGDEPCTHDIDYDNSFMNWADSAGVGYLAWAWWDLSGQYDDPRPSCSLGLVLGYTGTPRPGGGQAIHDHFAALSAAQGGGPVH